MTKLFLQEMFSPSDLPWHKLFLVFKYFVPMKWLDERFEVKQTSVYAGNHRWEKLVYKMMYTRDK